MGNKTEYSKKILIILLGIQIFITISAVVLMFYCQTTEGLEYLIPSISAELSVAIGFYYWKARKENEIKLSYYCKQLNIEEGEEENE